MSGHSKWSQIKRQKGVADQKRGQAFTRLGNAISIAVREGGGIGDPESNFKLRLAVEKARAANMPKENIQRAIDRAGGKNGEVNLETVKYEGFAPSGVAVVVECITDNKLRTQGQVKNYFDKNGGTMASTGAVSYLFTPSGEITVNKTVSFEEIFAIAADLGVEDVEEAEDAFDIYCQPGDLHKAKTELEKKGLKVLNAEIILKPATLIAVSEKDKAEKIVSFLQNLEELDDVQKVYSNVEIAV
ncbi:MAG: YebC/PmpR family DNA-binding transcriptional regulator [Patescibacteria group bacterium]|nr:YebC/PmpR family DNA-binding transcriptional regulator [Patescibacteria group bacterium]